MYNTCPISGEYRKEIIDIFNYYVENGFSAYPDEKVPYEFYDKFFARMTNYPTILAKSSENEVLGFGTLYPFHPLPVFKKTAEIAYFIKPGETGKGLGTYMLNKLLSRAQDCGINNILANISSFNEGSIRFHKKNGFEECGRFKKVGAKSGKVFDMIWMQKLL